MKQSLPQNDFQELLCFWKIGHGDQEQKKKLLLSVEGWKENKTGHQNLHVGLLIVSLTIHSKTDLRRISSPTADRLSILLLDEDWLLWQVSQAERVETARAPSQQVILFDADTGVLFLTCGI